MVMKNRHGAGAFNEMVVHTGAAQSEILLRAEVGFWRDLIEGAGRTAPPESIERMQQALALAECRLLGLFRDRPAVVESRGGPESTSGTDPQYLN